MERLIYDHKPHEKSQSTTSQAECGIPALLADRTDFHTVRFSSFSALYFLFFALLKNNADLLCVWSACVYKPGFG